MKCQECGSLENKVIESRDVADGQAIRRRRQCLECNHRFTTYERLERPSLVVVKRNGTRELFSREKLLNGLAHATEKTAVTNVQLENFVAAFERGLYAQGEPEVSSVKIGEMVMAGLPKISEVAYVRFASVYRKFRDISSFERELTRIREAKTDSKSGKSKNSTSGKK